MAHHLIATGASHKWKHALRSAKDRLHALAVSYQNQRRRDYGHRRQNLQSLGFASYPDYLNSPIWQAIRRRILLRDDYRCQSCHKADATEVHHLDYEVETLKGDHDDGLLAVCRGCHEKAEFEYGEKVPLGRANSRLRNPEVIPLVRRPQPAPKPQRRKRPKRRRIQRPDKFTGTIWSLAPETRSIEELRAYFAAQKEAGRKADEHARHLRKAEQQTKLLGRFRQSTRSNGRMAHDRPRQHC